MQEIKYIPVRKLWGHPDNPRKDLGDLSELVDSIKANGVLQNLTVVPKIGEISEKWDGESYMVIIGHRRLAAAKKAGLEEVPCVVTEMARSEQLKTMLIENMQRSDLTVYEQAQGFQLMLDMGETVETIAKESGFSTTTVRRRVKLLELDPDKFKESEARGASIQDYIELEKIHDPGRKNKVLDAIGTANFAYELKRAIEAEDKEAWLEQTNAALSEFATEIDERGKVGDQDVSMRYVCGYQYYSKGEVERPDDADEVRYFFTANSWGFSLFSEKGEDAAEQIETEEQRIAREKREAFERKKAELNEINTRHFELRKDFVTKFSAVKKHAATILRVAADALVGLDNWNDDIDEEIVAEVLGIELPDDAELIDLKEILDEEMNTRPEKTVLALAYSSLDRVDHGYWDWHYSYGESYFEYETNDDLDRLYKFLTDMGYKMSDEELAMQNGSHELLQDEEPAEQEASDDNK